MSMTIATGRLMGDPEVRYTQDEKPVAHFRIAVDGKENFISCMAEGGLAKICGEYLTKGRLVAVEGVIKTRPGINKSGKRRKVTEMVVKQLQMLDFRKDKEVR